ncbi:MAG: tryptophan--tRNA ligase [Candidatus Wildermuthbacteria bacterium]|nr:tryptophan--tRNA ligase [Candidatus Wildermuthbacteria bacterium]
MRIFSGIQPTGQMHIGNYLGAVRNWVALQKEHECLFCVVDLHALTVPQDPKQFPAATLDKVIELIALGIDPERSTIFVQSHVREHTELAWILNTMTPLSELMRMTQFKDKAKKHKDNINAGLLTYPVLMAGDILLYRTDAVPVGEDQTQHLEFASMVAEKFNARYGTYFKKPRAIIPPMGARVMSLQDPVKKMSKSDPFETQITMFEEPESIIKKIRRAVTDTGKEVRFDPKRKPGISNLMSLYALLSECSVGEVEKRFEKQGYSAFKKAVGEFLASRLEPFRKKKKELDRRRLYVEEIIRKGAQRSRVTAQDTMREVKERVGMLEQR